MRDGREGMLASQRELFDIPEDLAWFNIAYNGPLLKASAVAMEAGARSKLHPWERRPVDFFEDAERFRRLAARAFGGAAECYAVIPSASYGITTVARIMEARLGPGDEVLVLDEAFPSNFLPWERLCAVTGARLAVADKPGDHDWTAAVLERIGAATRVVAVPNVHWTNGAALDLVAVGAAARSVGAALVLELTQSLGVMPLDLEAVRPDFMVAAGYKWMLFPYGLGLFYAAAHWHGARPLEETWQGRAGAERFEALIPYGRDYMAGARRFEMGEKAIPSVLPGGLAALEQIGDWGVAAVARRLAALNARIAAMVEAVGLVPVPEGRRSPHMLGVSAPDGLPEGFMAQMVARGVHISTRGGALRFAPHMHVSEADMARLEAALGEVLG